MQNQLPSLKPFIYNKHKTEVFHPRDPLLDKVNTFTKQQTKLYQTNRQQALRVEAKALVEPVKKFTQPQERFVNNYYEMSKLFSANHKTREKIRATNTIEPNKLILQDKMKKEEKNLNDIFQVLHKDQHQIIAFYHNLNKNEQKKVVCAPSSQNHNLISSTKVNEIKQKVFI